MSRVFITGSADGLGRMAAQLLVLEGHHVVVHGRTPARAQDALAAIPGAEAAVAGDLSTLEGMTWVAQQVNELGTFDSVIHNAGVGYREPKRLETADGLSHVFAVNSVAPYLLTALIRQPSRLVFVSSGLHRSGSAELDDLDWRTRSWNGFQAYADSKLHDVLLAMAMARLRPETFSNALEPGWVATKMGGAGAPDDLTQGPVTQAWLAAGDDRGTDVTGEYFFHKRPAQVHPAARDITVQDGLLAALATITGVSI